MLNEVADDGGALLQEFTVVRGEGCEVVTVDVDFSYDCAVGADGDYDFGFGFK